MSSFELNKVIGALLLAVLTVVVIGKLGDNLVASDDSHDTKHADKKVVTAAAAPAVTKKPEPLMPILGILASADAAAGKKVFKKCASCHKIGKDAKNGVGPRIWNLVGSNRGIVPGFGYSDAMKSKKGNWTYESLNAFLAKPKRYIPGTRMQFGGVKKASDRANLVAYLRNASDTPAPLPSKSEIDAVMKSLDEARATDDLSVTQTAKEAKLQIQITQKPVASPMKAEMDLAKMLASADVNKGKRVFNKCKSCHTAEKGGKKKIGPNMWGIVNKPIASTDGFSYSSALKSLSDKSWSYENLNAFLLKPRGFSKGTKMTFAGLKKESDRANVIAYLRSLSENPVPLP